MRRIAAFAAVIAAACAVLTAGAGASLGTSWAEAQIDLVTSQGLMGGDAATFRPDDPLTQGDLADLLAALSLVPQPASVDPSAPVTIAQLDARLVKALGLGPSARLFATGARADGLVVPSRFGTEVVARLLGFRTNHPRADDALEPAPTDPATRAEAAYSAAKILGWKGWEAQYAKDLASGFAIPELSDWQWTVLQTALPLIGYPYVFGGTSERPQAPLGQPVPGGFDCSGFVWRVYKLSRFATGTPLADTVQGRTAAEMAGEVPMTERIPFEEIEPADVLFFGPHGPRSQPAEIDHVGIYLGGGWMISASNTGVALAPVATGGHRQRFAWARRPLAEAHLV